MGNEHYWSRKEEMAKKALKHTLAMDEVYKDDIKNCIERSIIWSAEPELSVVTFEQNGVAKVLDRDMQPVVKDSTFKLIQTTTDGALKGLTGKTVVLNFASYKHPGGAFLNGSLAQEEALCHNSFLYNVLKELKTYYDWNNLNKNRGLYTHRAVYTPDVKFFDAQGNEMVADVITCAAPNKSLLDRYASFKDSENDKVLAERVSFVKTVAQYSGNCDNIVLGAWGCGVFHQNPVYVSKLFMNEFKNSVFDEVIFAVPDEVTYLVFKESLEGRK